MPNSHHQNFRLRGIPCGYQSRSDVRELVKKILSIGPDASVIVHSLAVDPGKHDSKVATLSFHTLPDCLSNGSRNEWVFSLPVNEYAGGDDSSRRNSLVLDTHFSGFTPLQRTNNDDYYVE